MRRYIVKLAQQAARRAWEVHRSGGGFIRAVAGIMLPPDDCQACLLVAGHATSPQFPSDWHAIVGFHDDPATMRSRLRQFLDGQAGADIRAVAVLLGEGAAAGRADAAVLRLGERLPVDALTVVGACYPRVALGVSGSIAGTAPVTQSKGRADDIWSRSRGAMGEETFNRLQSLRVAVVGCGRSGQLAANSLHRLGASVLLIDDDRVEWNSLGESPVLGPADVGRQKAAALADHLRVGNTMVTGRVEPLPLSALDRRAVAAMRGSDLIVTTVDNGAARLLANTVAALFLVPLLDVGTGVFGTTDSDQPAGLAARRLGADIRLVLPGRCLLCTGGIRDTASARDALLAGNDTRRTSADFRGERAGSLASLNGLAVNFGVQMLLDWLAGRIREDARWLQLQFDPQGHPSLESLTPARSGVCPLCRHAGRGDTGLSELRQIIATL